ncbi:MAG: peptide chain release factor N(5)-glutamine methyltransferase [Ruminococcus sp.]|nr:peptide chain release factor N(5)-glutamine methyltransferase [Ruminococcus sp.]
MSSYAQLLEKAADELENAGVEDAHLNARELLGKALGCGCRSFDFEMKLKECAESSVQYEFESLCRRRMNGEPLQYLIGEWEFYGLAFKVGEGVLIPRQDTETLVDIVRRKAPKDKPLTVADLCAGSGCIGIALEKYLDCGQVIAVEVSDKAIEYMKQNIALNGSKMQIVKGDVTDRETAEDLPFVDVLTANPPYLTSQDMKVLQREVSFEPQGALFGGDDGLDFYRHILINFKHKLKTGGLIALEIGIGMQDEVMTMLVRHGFENVRANKDACGIFRVITGFKK